MTEEAWLAGDDPQPMLAFLRGKAGDRKLRLFVCALARRAWPALSEDGRRAVDVAERLADGRCGEAERLTAYEAAGGDWAALYTQADGIPAKALLVENPDYYCADAAASVLQVAGDRGEYILEVPAERVAAESAAQCDLLRCIVGNPLRPVTADTRWRTIAAVALASAMYESRDFSAMPVLADALEEAGCQDVAILSHCREQGTHVRGCWVVDGVLGKG
jgi:hypothetical protein